MAEEDKTRKETKSKPEKNAQDEAKEKEQAELWKAYQEQLRLRLCEGCGESNNGEVY